MLQNKKIYEKGIMVDGWKNGNWITNYYDGSIKSIVEFDNGTRKPTCHECNEYKKCKAIISNYFIQTYLTMLTFLGPHARDPKIRIRDTQVIS